MVKRLCDVAGALAGLVLTAPIVAIAAVGIRCSSPGPVLYRAARIGRYGRPFTMFKLRTMHVAQAGIHGLVTAANDARVFWFGRFLRATKIDELPQLLNVLRGEMSIIGPRPEDPQLVSRYAPLHQLTLNVPPGLASPGSLYHDTHGQQELVGDADRLYLERLLPVKLALDLVYLERASLWYDLRIVGRTLATIFAKLLDRPLQADPPEMADALLLITPVERRTRHRSPLRERTPVLASGATTR